MGYCQQNCDFATDGIKGYVSVVVCSLSFVDRLRFLGNAVVPLCAALAFVYLWTDFQFDEE